MPLLARLWLLDSSGELGGGGFGCELVKVVAALDEFVTLVEFKVSGGAG